MINSIQTLPGTKYQWNQGWANPIAHTDITLVIAELKEIEQVRGEITPDLVVESSKNKKSVLHNYFEWDNEKAANSWRMGQASMLLRRIEVRIISDGEPKLLRAYAITKKADNSSMNLYSRFDKMTNEDICHSIKIVSNDLIRCKSRLAPYSIYADAITYIDKALDELNKEIPESYSLKDEITPSQLISV